MARPRFRVGRILTVLVLFVLLCLLLELNRFLPGGWPGGGGDGGLRRAGQLDLDDVPGTTEADRPAPTRMKEAEGRPPVRVPRDGVVIEVRQPDGTYRETWRFGLGEGGPEDEVSAELLGRHTSKDRRIVEDGFRVRAGEGLIRVLPTLARTDPGHWIVVAPGELPRPARRRTRFDVLVEATWGTSKVVRVEAADGTTQDVPVDDQGKVALEGRREPFRVAAVIDGIEGAARWVGPRTSGAVALDAPPEPDALDEAERARVVLLPKGAIRFAARYATPVGSGVAEPVFRVVGPEGEAGTGRTLRVPKDVAIDVLVDDPTQRPYSVTIEPGTATQEIAYEVHSGKTLTLRVRDPAGNPVAGAFVVAGVSAAPFLALRHDTTDTAGRAVLRGIPLGPLGVFVAAPDQGFATRRVLIEVKGDATHDVRLARGLPLHVVVSDPEGLPIPGATVDLEPQEQGAPVPSAPRPTSGVLPEVSPAVRAALGWTDTATDERGGWRAEGLPVGRYRLRVRAPGHERMAIRDVEPGVARTWFVTLLPAR